ncbi:cytochrome P450 [Epithele typhae]|uniref:cytochrome P450 n=1 Tax=Epithele typhae TaxID=378194 RepID=UPI00200821EE|nr:cytochrome P450 [Epithele typhae]KAH9924617.1 cytochrome P450 [Epithele typhae]
MLSFLSITALAVSIYLVWKIHRNLVARRPEDNIPGPPLDSWFLGRHKINKWVKLARTYGSTFTVKLPIEFLVSHDPKALHHVFVKEADSFPRHPGLMSVPRSDFQLLIGPGILTAEGVHHRRQRKLLNPVFSSARLRDMTHIFYAGRRYRGRLPSEGVDHEMDVNGWMARTTLEMLGQAGLGYSFDNFLEDSTDEFGDSLKKFFPVLSKSPLLQLSVPFMSYYLSESVLRFLWRHIPYKQSRAIIEISDTMYRRSKDIIAKKKLALAKGDQALAHQVGEGKDIMSICCERMDDEELIAQMSCHFILAGMDTTSNALSRILYLLSEHPEVQEKLRGDRSDLAYDDLTRLPYLDAVCRETLRLYAPVPIAGRMAAKDTVVPLLHPIKGRDGREMHELVITRGTFFITNIQATNVDKTLWGEDAEEWKPERWLGPLPSSLEDARVPGVYAHLMTFAAGSTACIGFKFSQVEMKVILASMLPCFSFSLTKKEVVWNSSPVIYPSMGYESDKPEMLLMVKSINV